jgi:glycosyltransferase involved in cell wall biosynthesis
MRVLILAPRVPYPADHGAALRNLHLLRWLGQRHRVTLVAFGDPNDRLARDALGDVAERIEILPSPGRPLGTRLYDFAITGAPDLARRLWSPALVERLGFLLSSESYDLVQIEALEMASAWEAANGGWRRSGARVVLDAHNAEYVLQESAARASARQGSWIGAMYSGVQARRLRSYERDVCRAVDGVIAVSEEDERALQALAPEARTVVVPNGVDASYYQPGPRQTDGATALFIGKLDYRPNLDAIEWLADAIWPRVLAVRPDARLLVVGRDPHPRLSRLRARPGIELVGPVPDERPWFDRSDALLVPARMGGGVRLKVVQALAMGVPIVATDQAVTGVGLQDGGSFLRANTADAFAAQIVCLFGDAALRACLAAAGRAIAVSIWDWSVILPRLDAFYDQILSVSHR